MSVKVGCKVCFKAKKSCTCKKHKTKACLPKSTQLVNVLNTISEQLVGINTNLNDNINNLSTVISTNNNNLNSNLASGISSLNANLKNTIIATTNTIVSNMNTINLQTCEVNRVTRWTDFTVACGTSQTYFENLSAGTPEKVVIRAGSAQPYGSPCQAVLVILKMDGTVVEQPLPPQGAETNITIDNYASISIRCERGIEVPDGATCAGFIEIREYFCLCCSPAAAVS
ncbi:hypothetical protein M3194_28410 [Paenibacillus glycanilyticus]|uniref:hypothetical protein n=1 Tax=Paenibacillus glycanilyticus TaxID=126569 RepID=UPI00203DA4C3|nr:hypothetical protein [Paenibacillus glycanilyticus]MCM3631230.1 hypothetical protein [Paenibacillus glycanilyticus]